MSRFGSSQRGDSAFLNKKKSWSKSKLTSLALVIGEDAEEKRKEEELERLTKDLLLVGRKGVGAFNVQEDEEEEAQDKQGLAKLTTNQMSLPCGFLRDTELKAISTAGSLLVWANETGRAGCVDMKQNNLEILQAWTEGLESPVAVRSWDEQVYVLESLQVNGRLRSFDAKGRSKTYFSRLMEPVSFDIGRKDGSIYVLEKDLEGSKKQRSNTKYSLRLLYLDGISASEALIGPNPHLRKRTNVLLKEISRSCVDVGIFKDKRVALIHRHGVLEIWNPYSKTYDLEVKTGAINIITGGLTILESSLFMTHEYPTGIQLVVAGSGEKGGGWGSGTCVWSFHELLIDETTGEPVCTGDEIGSYTGPYLFDDGFPNGKTVSIMSHGSNRCECFLLGADNHLIQYSLPLEFGNRGDHVVVQTKLGDDSSAVKSYVRFGSRFGRTKQKSQRVLMSTAQMKKRTEHLSKNGAVLLPNERIVVEDSTRFNFENCILPPTMKTNEITNFVDSVRLVENALTEGRDCAFVVYGARHTCKTSTIQFLFTHLVEKLLESLVVLHVEEQLWIRTVPPAQEEVEHQEKEEAEVQWDWRKSKFIVDNVQEVKHVFLSNEEEEDATVNVLAKSFKLQYGSIFVEFWDIVDQEFAFDEFCHLIKYSVQSMDQSHHVIQKEMCHLFEGATTVHLIACVDEEDPAKITLATLTHAQIALHVPKCQGRVNPRVLGPQLAKEHESRMEKLSMNPKFSSVPVRTRPTSARPSRANRPTASGRIFYVQSMEWVNEVLLDRSKDTAEISLRPKAVKVLRKLFKSFDNFHGGVLSGKGLENFIVQVLNRREYLKHPEAPPLHSNSGDKGNNAQLFFRDFLAYFQTIAMSEPKTALQIFERAGLNLNLADVDEMEDSAAHMSHKTKILSKAKSKSKSTRKKDGEKMVLVPTDHPFWRHTRMRALYNWKS